MTVLRGNSVGPSRLEMVCIHASETIVQEFVEAELEPHTKPALIGASAVKRSR